MNARALLLSMLVCATDATAQSQISGQVQGAGDVPLYGVQIILRDSAGTISYNAISDKAGNFVLTIARGAATGLFLLRAEMLGYATIENAELRIPANQPVALTVEMEEAAIPLRALNVVSDQSPAFLTGFRERANQIKRGGGGYIIDGAALARDGSLSIARVLASVPGLHYVPGRRNAGETVLSTRGNCQPRFYLDGVPMAGVDISIIMANTLEGVEVYNGPGAGPVEYFDRTGCAVVLMWSRRGEPATTRGYPVIGLAIVGTVLAALLLVNK